MRKRIAIIPAVAALSLALLVSLAALASPASAASFSVTTYGAKGDGVTNDATAIQSAINAAATSGGTVTFPAGTFRIGSTIRPKSNVTLSGVAGQTVLTMPAQATRQYMFYAENLSNLTLTGLSFRAGGYADNVSGMLLPGAQNCRASNLYFEGLVYGMKLGSGSTASGWVVSDIVVRNTEMPMYISYVHDSSFTRLDLEAVRLYTTTGDHAIYMERENRNLTFNDCSLTGGSGYCLQLYMEGGSSSGITFNNLSLDSRTGRYPLVISTGYSDVTFTNSTIIAGADNGVIRFYGGSNVTFDGFAASGGSQLATVAGTVSNVVLRNGSYTGKNLGSGVTFENVTAGGTTPTTLPPTTSTTVAPTTSTTVPPTTSTTLAPTTTTASTTTTSTTTTTVVTPSTTTTSTSTTVAPTTSTTLAPTTSTTLAPPEDPTAEVTITTPADGSSVLKGRVTVNATVSSAVRIGKVVFYVDGRRTATDYMAGYSFSWTTRYLSSGSLHALKAIAYDRAGVEIGSASSVVRVASSTAAPTTINPSRSTFTRSFSSLGRPLR